MASIKEDNNLGGKRTYLKQAASHPLPEDPVQKKRLTCKRPAVEISGVKVTGTGGGWEADIFKASGFPSPPRRPGSDSDLRYRLDKGSSL